MYYFSIPDSWDTRNINLSLLKFMSAHRDLFYDDFVIQTAYGAPGCCIWNGNRIDKSGTIHSAWKNLVLEPYAKYGVSYRLTYTNFLLEPRHLYDTYGNFIAAMCSNFGGGSVMVSTPLMAQYMKKYPGLKVCWSTTTDFGSTEKQQMETINRLSEKSFVVLPYEFNNSKFLDELLHPENIEVLVNEKCIDNCPNRRLHWTENNKYIIMQSDVDMPCAFERELDKENEGMVVRHHLVERDLLPDYTDKGINHFKLEGRKNADNLLLEYMDYFVREGYCKDVAREISAMARQRSGD